MVDVVADRCVCDNLVGRNLTDHSFDVCGYAGD
jgi:hypothetical protein